MGLVLSGLWLIALLVPAKLAWADQSKVVMSAEVVTPTNLFVQVAFTGWSVPYGKVILWDKAEGRIYIQQELDDLGDFKLPFVLDRTADELESFELFAQYKGLESNRLLFEFSPGTYDPNSTINLVLPPLVDISQAEITSAQEVKLIAYACANCEVTWRLTALDGSVEERVVLTNEFGYAEVLVKEGLAEGVYQINATAKKENFQSQPSLSLELTVRVSGSLAGVGQEGVYAYGAQGITIEGLPAFMESIWFRLSMVGVLGVLLAWLLRSWLEIIDLLHRMWRWIGPLPGWLFGNKRKKEERYLRVYKAGGKKPILEEHLHGRKEPFHLELPPGHYWLVWEEPDGREEKTDLVVASEAHTGAETEPLVEIASTPPVAIKPLRDKRALKKAKTTLGRDSNQPETLSPAGSEDAADIPEFDLSVPDAAALAASEADIILEHKIYP